MPRPPDLIRPSDTPWWNAFPQVAHLEDPIWTAIREATVVKTLPAGTTVFRSGDLCENYFLVLEGSVRVQKLGENGREITLYRVEKGDACVLTTSCLLAREHYPAEGVTETEVTAAIIPMVQFQKGLDQSPGFRQFIQRERWLIGPMSIDGQDCQISHIDRKRQTLTRPKRPLPHLFFTGMGLAAGGTWERKLLPPFRGAKFWRAFFRYAIFLPDPDQPLRPRPEVLSAERKSCSTAERPYRTTKARMFFV